MGILPMNHGCDNYGCRFHGRDARATKSIALLPLCICLGAAAVSVVFFVFQFHHSDRLPDEQVINGRRLISAIRPLCLPLPRMWAATGAAILIMKSVNL